MREQTQTASHFRHRYGLLRAISELVVEPPSDQGRDAVLSNCCNLLLRVSDYSMVWIGKREAGDNEVIPLQVAVSKGHCREDCLGQLLELIAKSGENEPAMHALKKGTPVVFPSIQSVNTPMPLKELAKLVGSRSCIAWPLIYNYHEYGVLTVHSSLTNYFKGREKDFIADCAAEISRLVFVHETSQRLKHERDFNRDIIDTLEALVVIISPCGEILSFNHTAQQVTGYSEDQVRKKYWVDVLIAAEKRAASQRMFSKLLHDGTNHMHFQAVLQTRSGSKRTINWHSSIRRNIEEGEVGLVLFGIDITEKLIADQALDQAKAKWEHIFFALQDPVLVVNQRGVILDVNPATLTAARKKRPEVLGKNVCDLFVGQSSANGMEQIKAILESGKSRILETELRGLHGNYILTISPLLQKGDGTPAALILARDLTEEKLMKAEAVRASQLAVVGELAAGVAHEINNPVNGIINYAQLLMDMEGPATDKKYLQSIIREGKRIAGFTKTLLDFSRKQEEVLEPVKATDLIQHCIELVQHQYTKDGIHLTCNLKDRLPEIYCNPQHIQQVLLNVLSNARYALNLRFPIADKNKRLEISTTLQVHGKKEYARISVVDYGTGIPPEIRDKIMDPFFSTKPPGEGTGLGLSISQSLVHENNGYFRINSDWGHYTGIAIDLPLARK